MMTKSRMQSIQMAAKPAGLKFKAPQNAVNKWDRSIKAKASPQISIDIMGEIGESFWSESFTTATMIKKQLDAAGKSAPIKVTINSPGGDAFEGIAIYNLLVAHTGNVTVDVIGIAASAASIIAMAGSTIRMHDASMMMIHSAAGMVMGNSADMAEFAELLAAIDQQCAELYARRTGTPVKDVLKLMQKETWMSAKEAVEKGFADVAVAEPKETKPSASLRSSSPAPSMAALLAASGKPSQFASVRMSAQLPGVSGNQKGNTQMKTLHEQLAELREMQKAKMLRQGEIKQQFDADAASVTVEMRAEWDAMDSELNTLEDQIRIKNFEIRQAQAAQPVTLEVRGPSHYAPGPGFPYLNLKVKDADEKFKGQNFTRKIIARAAAFLEMQSGNFCSPGDIAQQRWGKTNPTLVNVIRMAAVPGFGTGSGEPGSELVTSDNRFTGDFLEFLYGMTVFDRLPLREVPAYVTIKGTDGAAIGYWVGESKAIPLATGSASSVQLTPLKVAAIAAASNELLRYADPSAELWIRDLLVNAIAQRIDTTFLSASAASAGVSPAGILNGVTAGTSAGTSADNVRTDLMVLAQNFIDNKNASNLWLVTSPGLLLALNILTNALGQPEFTGITPDGGNLRGYRILAGDNVGSGDVIMLKPEEIWKIGDTGLQVSFSRDATIEQQDNPTGATDTPTGMTTTNMTSAFQEDSTFIKVVRPISFAKRRTHAVAYIGDAGYGGVAS